MRTLWVIMYTTCVSLIHCLLWIENCNLFCHWFLNKKKKIISFGSGMQWLASRGCKPSHLIYLQVKMSHQVSSLSSFIRSFKKQWSGQSLSITWLSVSTWETERWNNKWCWRSGLWHIESIAGECFFHDACLCYFWLKWMAFSSSFSVLTLKYGYFYGKL